MILDLHRCITLMSKERLNVTVEEFFILMLLYTNNIADLYRFAREVPQIWSHEDTKQRAIPQQVFDGLVDKGYIQETKGWNPNTDLFIERYELIKKTFEDDIIDSRFAADVVFDMWDTIMYISPDRPFTSRNVGREEVELALVRAIGFTSRDVDSTYLKTKGSRRLGNVMKELNLHFIDKVKFDEVREGTEKYLALVKAGGINPMALDKFLRGEMWAKSEQEQKQHAQDYSIDL